MHPNALLQMVPIGCGFGRIKDLFRRGDNELDAEEQED